ncbi:MAG TPA: two-component regulator propeller domain-containing protein [Candidatus Acidoferrales bacterium]|nr:two-component regulator propeller domain-containing protein [Candidatus Acidoferrales bacterium]
MIFFSISVASAAPANSRWSVHTWQSDDGLPNNNVTGLAQTPDGYLWVANLARLARFDGVDFEEFPNDSFVPRYDKRIGTLLVSRQGKLWMAMEHGPVICLDSGAVRGVFIEGLPDLDVQSLTEDHEGAIWITYHGNREVIYRLKDGKITQFKTEDGATMRFDCPPTSDNQGRIWLAQDGVLDVFRDGRFQTLLPAGKLANINQLACASAGGVWILSGLQLCQYEEGGALRNCGTIQPVHPNAAPTALLEDRAGAVWIGTTNSGLFRYNGSGFESVPTSHDRILSLMEDREGNIWAGTGGGGLDRIRPRVAELEGAETGAPFEWVQSICEDTSGVLWATTDNGQLVKRTDDTWNVVSSGTNWPGGRATSVVADKTGALWTGTRSSALYCWQNGAFRAWRPADGLASHIIRALLVSKKGDLWIGGGNPESLQRLRNGHLFTLQIPANVSVIRALAEDASGDIWVGTSKGILLRVHDDQVTDETTRIFKGVPLSIRCFYVSSDGSLWIGHAGLGLGRFKNGSYAQITTQQGLYDNYISQIVADDRGWFWFGSDHGIFKARQQELNDVADGRIARAQSIHYGRSEDLPSLQANFGTSPGALRSHDGRLWFPMSTALAVIDPGKLSEDMQPPSVLLKQVLVDDRVVMAYHGITLVYPDAKLPDPPETLRLAPGYHQVEFTFTAPSFSAPENVHFRYRLEGFDEDWKDAGSQRTVSYPRLDAGHYQFQVRACNSDDVWNETGAQFALIVMPFVWQTWWFRLATLVLVIALIVMIVRYVSFRRLRFKLQTLEQQAALNRERSRIARDIHDDLGGNLTQAIVLLDLSQKHQADSGKLGGYLQQMSSGIRRIAESLDEIVWAANPGNDELPHFIDYIGQFAVEFLKAANIRCRIDLPEEPPSLLLAPEVRHNLFLAVKETLNNVVRHARASEVQLHLTVLPEALNIVIQDDGRGFDINANAAPNADGLRNMQQRLVEIGGQCFIESKPNSGTRVSMLYYWLRPVKTT